MPLFAGETTPLSTSVVQQSIRDRQGFKGTSGKDGQNIVIKIVSTQCARGYLTALLKLRNTRGELCASIEAGVVLCIASYYASRDCGSIFKTKAQTNEEKSSLDTLPKRRADLS